MNFCIDLLVNILSLVRPSAHLIRLVILFNRISADDEASDLRAQLVPLFRRMLSSDEITHGEKGILSFFSVSLPSEAESRDESYKIPFPRSRK